jgi:hypothetical protein
VLLLHRRHPPRDSRLLRHSLMDLLFLLLAHRAYGCPLHHSMQMALQAAGMQPVRNRGRRSSRRTLTRTGLHCWILRICINRILPQCCMAILAL